MLNSEDSGTCVPLPVVPTPALTAKVKARVCVKVPDVPVTVTEVNPVLAEGMALNTTFCLFPWPSTDDCTPFGRLETLRVTVPLNPPKSVIVMKAPAVEFWFKKTLLGPERVKPLLLTALLIALAYCAARPLPTKSS